MADNVNVTPGSGAIIATDELAGGVQIQCVKLDGGGDGLSVPLLAGNGSETGALRVALANDGDAVVKVSDNSASLTVDAPANAPVAVQLSDGSSAITTLPVSIAPGASSIAKTEDTAAASGDVGVPAMAVQSASPLDMASFGEYAMLQMGGGRLWVSAAIPSDPASIAKAEDLASSNFDTGVPAMAIQRATPADSAGTDGDYAMLQMKDGRLWTSGIVTAAAASIGKSEDAQHADGDVGVPALSVRKDTAAATSGSDNDYQPLITDANGRLHVIESAGTAGDVAHDAADSGNPVKIGAKAHAPFALQTAVAANDRVNLSADLHGRLRTVSHPDDISRLGVYYYHSGALVVAAAADAAATSGGGRVWIINPVGSGVTRRIRKVTFRSQLGSALLTPTSPRFLLEKGTFTGTASGTAITPTQRRTSDASPVGAGRTASTGMTVSASTVVASFFPVASASAVSYCPPTEQVFEPGPEDYLDLEPGECLILRQADAGTAADTRRCTCDFVVEEFA